jgi:putative ABC transport system substrate-binding protein
MSRKIFFFITAFAILVSAYPTAAQQTDKIHRIGWLSRDSAEGNKELLASFRQGLRELGYVEGKNIVIEQRYANGKRRRLTGLAAELIRLEVDIIVASGGAKYARKVTGKIPIVMTYSADPVGSGLVASLSRPGGNVTGLSDYHAALVTKRLQLLKEVVPSASRIAVILNPRVSANRPMLKDIQAAAPAIGVTVFPFEVKGPDDIDAAFAAIGKERYGGLIQLVGVGSWRKRIVELAAKSRLPTVYTHGGWVAAGGLMSYGTSHLNLSRRAATYVDKILKGANPADLPVEQPTRFSLTVSLKTAKTLGITIPRSVLLRADRVIE